MPATGTQFGNRVVPLALMWAAGQVADLESGVQGKPYQGASFAVLSGGANGLVADVTYNMTSALSLIPSVDVPTNRRLRPTRFDLCVHGNVAWAGGTGVILQDTAAYPLAFFPLVSLNALASYSFPTSGTNKPLIATASSYAATTGVITLPSSTLITTTLAGFPFSVVSGTGKGQSGIIASNTATTITPTTIPTTALDSTSVIAVWYYVATGAFTSTTIKASNATGWTAHTLNCGYYVVIVAGTGAGQSRAITDNTTTDLTVAAWDTTPDATSIFIVTNTPENFGAVDLAIGQHWSAPMGLGAGLQIALQGAFSGTTSSPIRAYVEGFLSI